MKWSRPRAEAHEADAVHVVPSGTQSGQMTALHGDRYAIATPLCTVRRLHRQ